MTNYGSRKFIVTLLLAGLPTWLTYEKVLTSGDYKTITIALIGLYSAGNVASSWVAKTKEG